jgi:hypothetical protein
VLKGKRPDYRFLLTQREKRVIKNLNKAYRERWRKAPTMDVDLVYYLGDNEHRKCWSATSGRIPTLRMAGGLMWGVKENRFLTGREKLGSRGFPITPKTASQMKVTELPLADVKRCSLIAGNCMHWSAVGIMQLISLSCFKLVAPGRP